MGVEIVTKEDLQGFRLQLIDDIRLLLESKFSQERDIQWLKSAQVRKLLKISPGSLQNLRIQGKLNPVKIGGSWYYSQNEIKSLFQK